MFNTLINLGLDSLAKHVSSQPTPLQQYKYSKATRQKAVKQRQKDRQKRFSKNAKFRLKNSRENTVRKIVENFFYPHKFPSTRPEFLYQEDTKRALELDCFNEALKLAFEVDGEVHFHYNAFYHKNDYSLFEDIRRRDIIKDRLCQQYGVKLIRIPYNIPVEDLEAFILEKIGCVYS